MPQLEQLFATLRSSDEEVRAWTSDILQGVSAPPEELVPQLQIFTTDHAPAIAGWACKLLSRTQHTSSASISALKNALSNYPELSVRELAAMALGNCQEISSDALLALKQAASATEYPRLARLASAAIAQHYSMSK